MSSNKYLKKKNITENNTKELILALSGDLIKQEEAPINLTVKYDEPSEFLYYLISVIIIFFATFHFFTKNIFKDFYKETL